MTEATQPLPTREEYEAARRRYREAAIKLQEAHQRGDYRERSRIARAMLPDEEVLNAYEAARPRPA